MLYYYEIRSQVLKTVDLKEETCPLCKHKGEIQMHILQKYLHMFGPINPLGKYGELDCGACETTIPANKWNKELDAVYEVYKNAAETPSRLWRGTWVLGMFFVFIYVFSTIATKFPELLGRHNTEQFNMGLNEKLNFVKEGDVLAIDFANIKTVEDFKTMYGIIKIDKISGDNVSIKIYSERFGDLDYVRSQLPPERAAQKSREAPDRSGTSLLNLC